MGSQYEMMRYASVATTASTPGTPARISNALEPRLHDPEPAGRDGDQRQQPGHGVGQQDQRRVGLDPGGPDAGQQGAEVEGEPPGAQERRRLPAPAQDPADAVALEDQPVRQAGQGRRLALHPVARRLNDPARPAQGRVQHEHRGAEAGEEHEGHDAEQRRVIQAVRDGCPRQNGGQQEDGEGEQPADAEQREGGQPGDRGRGIVPGLGEHAELRGRAEGGTPGHNEADGVAGELRRRDGEPRLGPQRNSLQRDGAGEVRHLEGDGEGEPDRVERGQLGEGAEDGGQAREDEVEGDAGHHRHDGLLGEGPPRRRRLDVLLNSGGEPLRHGVAAGGAVPGWGRTVLLGFVVFLRRHRRIVTGGERGSA